MSPLVADILVLIQVRSEASPEQLGEITGYEWNHSIGSGVDRVVGLHRQENGEFELTTHGM